MIYSGICSIPDNWLSGGYSEYRQIDPSDPVLRGMGWPEIM